MVIQVADHPLILICELEISLPKAVAMRPLKPTLTPNPSGIGDWVVQTSLVEDLVDGCVADCALLVVVA